MSKKILFFLINMNLGGTEKSFLNLLESLPKDVDIDLLLLENQGTLIKRIPLNVNVVIIENNIIINEFIKFGTRRFGLIQLAKGNFGLFFKSMIQFVLSSIGLIKNPYWAIQPYIISLNKKYDIAVAYAGIHNFIAYYILNNTVARKKVLWIHFDVTKVIRDFNFGKNFYALFDQFFSVSENGKKAFIKMFPFTAERSAVFPNIISKSQILKDASLELGFVGEFHGLRIVTLGRLSQEKGQQQIPAVVKRLKETGFNFKWYLIGDGQLMASLEQNIRILGVEDNLILLGSKINPYPFLKSCDLYVQTSFHEGYCITLVEAKVFNKPVVTTNFLSAPNLIRHNEDGLIVEISEEGIYQGVKTLLENEALRKKFSISYIREVDVEKNIERLLTIN